MFRILFIRGSVPNTSNLMWIFSTFCLVSFAGFIGVRTIYIRVDVFGRLLGRFFSNLLGFAFFASRGNLSFTFNFDYVSRICPVLLRSLYFENGSFCLITALRFVARQGRFIIGLNASAVTSRRDVGNGNRIGDNTIYQRNLRLSF